MGRYLVVLVAVWGMTGPAFAGDREPGQFDIGISTMVGWFDFPYSDGGWALDAGFRLTRWADPSADSGSLHLVAHVETAGEPTLGPAVGVRVQANGPVITPFLQVRGGAWIGIYPHDYDPPQVTWDPFLAAGGGLTMPGSFPVAFRLQADWLILPFALHGGPSPGLIPLRISMGIVFRI